MLILYINIFYERQAVSVFSPEVRFLQKKSIYYFKKLMTWQVWTKLSQLKCISLEKTCLGGQCFSSGHIDENGNCVSKKILDICCIKLFSFLCSLPGTSTREVPGTISRKNEIYLMFPYIFIPVFLYPFSWCCLTKMPEIMPGKNGIPFRGQWRE